MFFNNKSVASTLSDICSVIFNKKRISENDSQGEYLPQASDFLSCNIKKQCSNLNEPSAAGTTKKSIGRFRAHWLGLLFTLLPNVLMAAPISSLDTNRDGGPGVCNTTFSDVAIICALDVDGNVVSHLYLSKSDAKWNHSSSDEMLYCGLVKPTDLSGCVPTFPATDEDDINTYYFVNTSVNGVINWYSGILDGGGWSDLMFGPDLTPPMLFDLGSVLRTFDATSYASFELLPISSLDIQQTISFWVKPEAQSTNTQMLLIKSSEDADDANTTTINYSLRINPNSLNVRYSLVIDGNYQSVDSSNSLVAGQWNHVTATYDGSVMNIYIDGALDNSILINGASVYNNVDDKLFIGGIPNGASKGYVFSGLIDDVRLYNITRTQTEIESDMRENLTGNETGLVFNTRMDMDSNGDITDVSVSGTVGTLVGSARLQAILDIMEDNQHTFTESEFELDYLYKDDSSDSFSGIKVISLPSDGTLELSGSDVLLNQVISPVELQSITYTPEINFNGDDGFTWQAFDGLFYSDTIPFSLSVIAVNDIPVALEQSLSTNEDTPVSITLDGSDVDLDTLTFSVVSEPTSGALSGTEPHLIYTPDPDFNGLDSFTYKANDGTVDSEIVTFSITVNEVNELAAINDSYTVAAVVSTTLSVLDNDFEPDGETISLESAGATHGTVEVVSGELVFTPPEGLAGTVILEYLISDTTGGYDTAIVLITVEGNDDDPTITPPETVSVDAEGLYTKVSLGIAEAFSFSGTPLPVNLVNEITFFEPGVNYALWEATDANGNIIVAEQLVYVRPLISFNRDQTVLEGERVRIGVALNGLSPDYPLEIPYTVSGSSDSSDHTLTDGVLTINKGKEGLIITKIIEDNISDPGENLIITLDPSVNRGDKGEHEITISEDNIAPEISVTITQNDVQQKTVTQDNGNVVIQSSIFDPNKSDTHTYQWLVIHGSINDLDADDTSFTLDPSLLTPGLYTLQLTVTDDGIPSLSDVDVIYIRVVSTLPELGTEDNDGDLIVDNLEGYTDADGDGIPDYQDSSEECNILPHQTIQQDTFLIEGEPGVCISLGFYSINSTSGGTLLTDADIAQTGDDLIADTVADNIGGVNDFIAYGLPGVGQSYKIVIPQREVIPVDAVYRKFTADDGWFQFVEDSVNQIHSAPGERGFCPPPGDDKWESGLIIGYWCVQLTIEDGGDNDADEIANGTIVDPGGTAVAVSVNQAPVAEDDNIEMDQNTSINISVVVNDPDGDSIEMVSANANFGNVVIETDGTLTYTPIFGHIGVDTIVYGVSDGNGGVDSAFIYITINAPNSAPVAETDTATVLQGLSVTVDVLSNDSDVDGDELTVISADAGHGEVIIEDGGTLTYTPNSDYYGEAIIEYTIEDTAGNQASGLVYITVEQNVSIVTRTLVKRGGSMEYIVTMLLLLLILKRHMQNSKTGVRLVMLIGILVMNFNSHAAGTAEGWFVGGQIGSTETDIRLSDLQTILDQSGFDSEITSWDNSDTSYSFFAGYKLNENLSFQLDYIDWGERELELTNSVNVNELDNFYDAIEKIYPRTGDAYQISASYAWPLTESISLSGKLGLLKWDSDAHTFANDVIVGNDQDRHTEVVMGLELQYHLSRNTTIFLGIETVELENHPMNTIGLGVRYFLSDLID